jgi:DNA-binding NarL/FixJ family response regulator
MTPAVPIFARMDGRPYLASAAIDLVDHSADGSIRVVIAVRHPMMRTGLRTLLAGEPGTKVMGVTGDLSTAIDLAHEHLPDVVVLDLRTEGGSTLDAVRRLHEAVPAPRIVVISMEDSSAFSKQALDVGAVAYVVKDRADTDLPTAVRRAALGEHYESPRGRRTSGSDYGKLRLL